MLPDTRHYCPFRYFGNLLFFPLSGKIIGRRVLLCRIVNTTSHVFPSTNTPCVNLQTLFFFPFTVPEGVFFYAVPSVVSFPDLSLVLSRPVPRVFRPISWVFSPPVLSVFIDIYPHFLKKTLGFSTTRPSLLSTRLSNFSTRLLTFSTRPLEFSRPGLYRTILEFFLDTSLISLSVIARPSSFSRPSLSCTVTFLHTFSPSFSTSRRYYSVS